MDYTIYPFEGLGAIRFGMNPQQVREVVGEPDRTFMKFDDSKFPTDAYYKLGFYVYYDESGLCNSVEIWGTSQTTRTSTALTGTAAGSSPTALTGTVPISTALTGTIAGGESSKPTQLQPEMALS
jgi:hypothetical protein